MQTFRELRERNCYYVDKTPYIQRLLDEGKHYLFSQLNNLTDITLDPAYSSLCGYTEDDPEAVFAPELGGLDREQVREWYHGSSWLGAEKVYNPYDVLLLLRRGEPVRMEGSRCRAGAAGLCEGQPINLIGVEFSRATRNVTAFEVVDA